MSRCLQERVGRGADKGTCRMRFLKAPSQDWLYQCVVTSQCKHHDAHSTCYHDGAVHLVTCANIFPHWHQKNTFKSNEIVQSDFLDYSNKRISNTVVDCSSIGRLAISIRVVRANKLLMVQAFTNSSKHRQTQKGVPPSDAAEAGTSLYPCSGLLIHLFCSPWP